MPVSAYNMKNQLLRSFDSINMANKDSRTDSLEVEEKTQEISKLTELIGELQSKIDSQNVEMKKLGSQISLSKIEY